MGERQTELAAMQSLPPYRANAWEWSAFPDDDLESCVLGNEVLINLRSALSLSEVVPSAEAVRELMGVMAIVGRFEQLQLLQYRFEAHYRMLRRSYELRDGKQAVTRLLPPYDAVARFTTMLADYVSSGKRLTDRMGGVLRRQFGDESEELQRWRRSAADFFDDDLGYAVLQELRNEMEHGFAYVSIVNYDPKTREVGLAINAETGLLTGDALKASVRGRVWEYRDSQLEKGLPPWLSVGGMVKFYRTEACALYADCLGYLAKAYESFAFSPGVEEELRDFNCIYWRASAKKRREYALDRIYPLPGPNGATAMEIEMKRVIASLPIEGADKLFEVTDGPSA